VRQTTELASAVPPAPMPELLGAMSVDELVMAYEAYDEDCLSLNVWTPTLPDEEWSLPKQSPRWRNPKKCSR
jgi:carboxylesterase type B